MTAFASGRQLPYPVGPLMHVLHALPGRIRWHIPLLLDNPALADAVRRQLLSMHGVRGARAEPLTGSVLLEFAPALSQADAARLVDDAIAEALASPSPTAVASPDGPAPSSALMRLVDRAKEHHPLARKMLVSAFFNRLLDASPPILIGGGIDIVTRGRSALVAWMGLKSVTGQLLGLGGLGIAVWAVDSLLDYAHKTTAAELANRVRHDLRNDVYAQLQRLDVAQIEAKDVAEWMNLIEGDLAKIHGFIKDGSDPLVTIIANGVTVAGTSLALSPLFALAQFAVIPPVAVVSQQMLGPLRDRLIMAYRDSDRLSAIIHGNVSSLATINSFGAHDAELARVRQAGEQQLVTLQAADQMQALYVPTLTMIVGAGFMTTLVWGGMQVDQGLLAPGAFNMVATSQLRMLAAIGHFGASVQNYQRTSVALERVFRILDMQPGVRNRDEAVPIETLGREIAFDHVSFGYEPDRLVLRDFHISFPAGATIGIVGSSGAGKSTVLKLLSRFYDVTEGTITYDGVDIRDLKLENLHRTIAMVSQELAVFAGTIRENIAYARPEASVDDVQRAAEVAEAHDFISALPRGYDTVIGYGGHSLSAGQRQRIAIARVVLADRPIILFDEATSALDYQTEASVQRGLREATAGRTTIIVAHRLSTIRHADLIYVLDDGKVRERGRHDDLIKADGIYAAMWKVQTGELVPPQNGNGTAR